MGVGRLAKTVRHLDAILSYASLVQLALMVSSFAIGIYVVYFSKLTSKGIDSILSVFPIFFAGVPFGLPIKVTAGTIFMVLWVIYLGFFIIAAYGPRSSLRKTVGALRRREISSVTENSALMIAISYPALVVVIELITSVQGLFGIESGSPPVTLPAYDLASYSLAPITEEVGYRMTIVGIGLVIAGIGAKVRASVLKTLWHPSPKDPWLRGVGISLVLASAIIFGLAHIVGGTWKVGKFSEAALAGYVAGWLYLLQGFQSPVLLHWSFNYFATTYEFLGMALETQVPVLIMQSVTYFIGIIALARWTLSKLRKGSLL